MYFHNSSSRGSTSVTSSNQKQNKNAADDSFSCQKSKFISIVCTNVVKCNLKNEDMCRCVNIKVSFTVNSAARTGDSEDFHFYVYV